MLENIYVNFVYNFLAYYGLSIYDHPEREDVVSDMEDVVEDNWVYSETIRRLLYRCVGYDLIDDAISEEMLLDLNNEHLVTEWRELHINQAQQYVDSLRYADNIDEVNDYVGKLTDMLEKSEINEFRKKYPEESKRLFHIIGAGLQAYSERSGALLLEQPSDELAVEAE